MAKNLKLNIKNTQIAQAVNLSSLKDKIGKKKAEVKEEVAHVSEPASDKSEKKEEAPKIKARSRSAFADGNIPHAETLHPNLYPAGEEQPSSFEPEENRAQASDHPSSAKKKTHEPLEELQESSGFRDQPHLSPEALRAKLFKDEGDDKPAVAEAPHVEPLPKARPPRVVPPTPFPMLQRKESPVFESLPPREKLGPTGKHVKDLIPPPRPPARPEPRPDFRSQGPGRSDSGRGDGRPGYQGTGYQGQNPRPDSRPGGPPYQRDDRGGYPPRPQGQGGYPPRPQGQGGYPPRPQGQGGYARPGGSAPGSTPGGPPRPRPATTPAPAPNTEDKKPARSPAGKFREFRDIKPTKRPEAARQFDNRDRQGLTAGEDEGWRGKRRMKGHRYIQEDTIRPTSLKVRVPISIKDLAEKMKLKASQLVSKLFLQGSVLTLNDLLTDETMIQLLGQDFGCDITLDTTEEERIRITDKTIKEEINATDPSLLQLRPSVVAFMGHVDHGKTSLIDAIRSSNRASGEAGAITQHIGAFRCSTAVGDITILDTPGHEAFSSMRARGADVTDIVVLVVAGDEGIRQQTIEAINHAKAAGVTIVVAINKADKPNFDADTVYRQLSEQELLPEAWGGQTITINCSAVTKQGIKELLEMLALQAEILELRANPKERARGSVIESEMHKGMGSVATVLVQNGTLRVGDSIVFSKDFGKIKTMKDENGKLLKEAGPATPVMITGLSGLPDAGQEFIVVKSEKEAKEIAAARSHDFKQTNLLQKKKLSMDSLMQNASTAGKKILNLILRADVQGSLEALKVAIMKIESDKAEPNIIFAGVGEISESDVQLAAVSKAVIFGFHTQIEGHAESIIKEHGVQTRLHDIIYHAVDDVKLLLSGLLDKIAQETEKGKAVVKAVFSSSHYGQIAGCQVTEGSIARNNQLRIVRGKDTIWKGTMASLKRVKEDVKEVAKGHECGIVLNNFNDVKEGDVIEAYEITYLTQSL